MIVITYRWIHDSTEKVKDFYHIKIWWINKQNSKILFLMLIIHNHFIAQDFSINCAVRSVSSYVCLAMSMILFCNLGCYFTTTRIFELHCVWLVQRSFSRKYTQGRESNGQSMLFFYTSHRQQVQWSYRQQQPASAMILQNTTTHKCNDSTDSNDPQVKWFYKRQQPTNTIAYIERWPTNTLILQTTTTHK